MKKYAILFLAGATISLASCGDNKNETTQQEIDSIANARSGAMEAEMRAKNDSLINAMAMMKADSAARADSMARIAAGKPVTTTKTTITKTTTTTKPVKSNTTKDGRLDIDRNTSTTNDGRVNLDKNTTKETEKKQDKEGRLKID